MNENLKSVLDFLMRPCVEHNLPNEDYWGTVVDKNSVISVSPFFLVEINNLDNLGVDEAKYFSYVNNEYTPFKYPLSINQMRDIVAPQVAENKPVRFPLTNILNALSSLEPQKEDEVSMLKKSRVVISRGFKEEGDLTIPFKSNNGRMEFNNSKLPKQITVSSNSPIPEGMVREGVIYRCVPVENSDTIKVDVVEPFGYSRLGILYSPKMFIPEDMEAINRMVGIIPPDMIVCSNDKMETPVHLDASILNDVLKVFLLAGECEIEMYLSEDPNKPVLIKNIRTSDKDPDISVIVATLNPFFGAQRR